MYNTNTPPASDLPSSRTLLRSTLIAAGVALLILVTVVMPAEYGVDPTGVGRVLGLEEMGEIKQSLAAEAAAAEAVDSAAAAAGNTGSSLAAAPSGAPAVQPGAPVAAGAAAPTSGRTDTIAVLLQPGQGREIKLAMDEGARVNFAWSTDAGVVNYDQHADRTAAPAIRYHGYRKGNAVPSDTGTLVAAFAGMHGWFWRNRTAGPVTVTLRTSGDYTRWKEVK